MDNNNHRQFCPECGIGLNSREIQMCFCQNCKSYWDEATSPEAARYHQEPVWLKELIDIRNKLYNSLPTGEDNGTWDLLQMIKWHINDLDVFCSRISEYKGTASFHEQDDKIYCSHCQQPIADECPVAERDERLVWVEMKEGQPLPNYDEPALWLQEDGNMFVDALDKDGNPWVFQHEQNDQWGPYPKVTHWTKLPTRPGETPSHEGKDAVAFANFVGDRPLPEYSKSTNMWRWWSNEKRDYEYATTEQLYSLYTKSLKTQTI